MVEVWQYLEIQQSWWIRSRGAEGRGSEGGRQSPPQIHAGPGTSSPQRDRCPPQSGPATFFQIPPKPKTVLTLLRRSRHRVQLQDGSGWQRGRGRLGCGRGVSVRHSSAGRWVRGVGAERSRAIKSPPKKEEGKRGWGRRAPSLK